MEARPPIKIHILHCGTVSVSPSVPEGGLSLGGALGGVFCPESRRVTLPVSCYLIEHPAGRVLVDTGISRDISPDGVFDRKAANRILPTYLTGFFRPSVEKGCTAVEKLEGVGIAPEDLDIVLLTHLDPDHTAGLRSLRNAKRRLMPQEEFFWSCRTVFRVRQPWNLWVDEDTEYFWFKGTGIGPNWWSYDLFGDGSVTLVSLPGHTFGHIGVKIENNGKSLILCSDACFNGRNLSTMTVPGFGFSEKSMLRSLKWLRSEAEKPGCIGVIANHDPDVPEQVIEL